MLTPVVAPEEFCVYQLMDQYEFCVYQLMDQYEFLVIQHHEKLKSKAG